MIGAAIEARLRNVLSSKLLTAAAEKAPNDPKVWAAIAYRDFDLLQTEFAGLCNQCAGLYERGGKIVGAGAVVNSVPVYLEAVYQCEEANFAAARKLLREATRKSEFETYDSAFKHCIIQATESVGYSEYMARLVAFKREPAGHIAFGVLNRPILDEYRGDQEAAQDCLVLGVRFSQGRSILEGILGGRMQGNALE